MGTWYVIILLVLSLSLMVMSCCFPFLEDMTKYLRLIMYPACMSAKKKQDSVLGWMIILCLSWKGDPACMVVTKDRTSKEMQADHMVTTELCLTYYDNNNTDNRNIEITSMKYTKDMILGEVSHVKLYLSLIFEKTLWSHVLCCVTG